MVASGMVYRAVSFRKAHKLQCWNRLICGLWSFEEHDLVACCGVDRILALPTLADLAWGALVDASSWEVNMKCCLDRTNGQAIVGKTMTKFSIDSCGLFLCAVTERMPLPSRYRTHQLPRSVSHADLVGSPA